jgi:uncharacterized membrane protein
VANSPTHHPVVNRVNAERSADIQLRIADRITAFAGSMPFVYLHALAFGIWMLVFEKSPWPTLTLVVSLEAIFLSTFVMIGQNRQSAFQQAKADHDFVEEELELKTNTELTRAVHAMTLELHDKLITAPTPTTTDLRRPAEPGSDQTHRGSKNSGTQVTDAQGVPPSAPAEPPT